MSTTTTCDRCAATDNLHSRHLDISHPGDDFAAGIDLCGHCHAQFWLFFMKNKQPTTSATTEPPHSRACGIAPHPHGQRCHPNCPTCGGSDDFNA